MGVLSFTSSTVIYSRTVALWREVGGMGREDNGELQPHFVMAHLSRGVPISSAITVSS